MTNDEELALETLKRRKARMESSSIIEPHYLSDLPDEIVKSLQTVAIDVSDGFVVFERKRPQGKWVVTAEDNNGVHRICCPFCSYEKGSNNTDPVILTFTNLPKFCENCGADMQKGDVE